MYLKELGALIKIYEAIIPDSIKDLKFYNYAYIGEDIYVGHNSILIIDETISYISANNCYIKPGGRITQKSPYLVVDLTGEMKGGA